MTSMLKAGMRSGAFWQIVAGFMLGVVGTLATHSAQAEGEPPHVRPAPQWRIDR